jgi:uncharacterized protein (TIGR02391 family)
MIGRDQLRLLLLKRIQDEKTFHPGRNLYPGGQLDVLAKRDGLAPLTDDELVEASVIFQELLGAGFVARKPAQGVGDNYILTRSGEEFLKEQGKRKFFKVPIRDLVADPDILNKTESVLANGDLDLAVLAAFKVVEERLRAKSGLDPSFYGVQLVSKALNPKNGLLVYPHAKTQSESEAVHNLFSGSVGAFKNPASHRTVAYDDQQHALQTIALADLLVRYIDQLKPR